MIEIQAELERGGATTRLEIVDCDIHPAMHSPQELLDHLPAELHEIYTRYGARQPQPLLGYMPYPRMGSGNGARGDAWPPTGGRPGSDLAFMQKQHLDGYGIHTGILHPLMADATMLNHRLSAAVTRAVNDWQVEKWLRHEPRLKGTIYVTQDDPESAVAEIMRLARDRRFVQIGLNPRSIEPLGRPRYWPIFRAAAETGLPIGLHVAPYGQHANGAAGPGSYYIEEHFAFAHQLQTVIASMIFEGVFNRFPALKMVMVESGFGWAPSLAWRMDKHWSHMRSEVPEVSRPPSEYMREHFWFTTQPIEEPEHRHHFHDLLSWIGADRLLYSSDYPHWDFDDPHEAIKVRMSEKDLRGVLGLNAKKLYGID